MGDEFIKVVYTLFIHNYQKILLKKSDMGFPDSNVMIWNKGIGSKKNIIEIVDSFYNGSAKPSFINKYLRSITVKKLIEEGYFVCIRGENPVVEWFFSLYFKDMNKYIFEDDYRLYGFDEVFDHINNIDSMFQSERIKFILDSLNLINR